MIATISEALSGLAVARTNVRGAVPSRAEPFISGWLISGWLIAGSLISGWLNPFGSSLMGRLRKDRILRSDQLGDPLLCELEHLVELSATEGETLCGSLYFYEATRTRHDDVHVHFRPGIFAVVEIEQTGTVYDSDRNGTARIGERMPLDVPSRHQPAEAVVESDICTAYAGGAGTAVGLQHVAVDGYLHLTHRDQVGHGPKRSADETLDLLGTTRLAALRRLATDPFGGRPGKKGVLRRHPTFATAPQPRGNPILDRRRAENLRTAGRHEHRSGGEDREVPLERGRVPIVGSLAVVGADAIVWRARRAHTVCPRPTEAVSIGRPNSSSASE